MSLPGLFISDMETTANRMIPIIDIIRTLRASNFEGAREILRSLPVHVTYDDIIEWQNDSRTAAGKEPIFNLDDAVLLAQDTAERLGQHQVKCEVILPMDDASMHPVISKMIPMIKHGKVIMLYGGTGVGKSQMIRAACKLAGIPRERIGYFSMPTLAPEDFVGVPSPDPDDSKAFYYRMPKFLDTIEVMVLDETNRAHPKVLNAVLQLVLERRINDMHFTNLKAIIMAINPPEDGNFVGAEELDDALRERVDHFLEVKGQPDAHVIGTLIGDTEVARIGVEWYNTLTKDARNALNPRRLEKMLQAFVDGEGLDTTQDKRHPRGVAPIDHLQKMLHGIRLLNMRMLVEETDEVEARIAKGDADSQDIMFRFVELIKQMKAKRMDREFCGVAHLFNYVARDLLPTAERDKSLWGWVDRAITKHATPTQAAKFRKNLTDRAEGKARLKGKIERIQIQLASNLDKAGF